MNGSLLEFVMLIDLNSHIRGDILEFGTGSGKSAKYISEILKDRCPDKKIFTFDGFCGLPKTEKVIPDNTDWQEGNLFFDEQETRNILKENDNVFIHKTMINEIESLENYGVRHILAVNMDLDLYEGTRDALELIDKCKWDKIILRFDDWGAYSHQNKEQVAQHEQAAFFEYVEDKGHDWVFFDSATRSATKTNNHSPQTIVVLVRGKQ